MVALLLVILAFGSTDGHARSKHKLHADTDKKWLSEPTAFMSLPLGGPLAAEKKCAPLQPNAVLEVTSEKINPCWLGESNVKRFYNMPSPGFPIESVIAVTSDGMIGTVIVNGMRPEYARMKAYLIDTFGPPTQEKMKPMGQQGGLTLGVETLRWEGSDVAIRLDEIYDRVDMYRVIVFHKASTPHAALLQN